MKIINESLALNQARPDFIFSPPAIELLYNKEDYDFFLDNIKHSEVIKTDTRNRFELVQKLNGLFASWQGLRKMDESELIETYSLLIQFIESDSYNIRLLLYLPFELFADISEHYFSFELKQIIFNFRKLIKSKWLELLVGYNIRADFFDGDIPEPEICQSDLVLVSKAAHLLPVLFSSKLIDIHEAINLIENADHIVKSSLFDALFVAFDLGLISNNDLNKFSKSSDSWLRNFPIIIQSDNSSKLKSKILYIDDKESLLQLLRESKIEIEALDFVEKKTGYTQARIDWEKERDESIIIDRCAKILATSLINGKLLLSDFLQSSLFSNQETSILIGISGLSKLLIEKSLIDLSDVQIKCRQFKDLLSSIYLNGSAKIKELIEQTYLHWHHLNIIDVSWLDSIGLKPICLDSLFFWDENNLNLEKDDLTEFLKKIQEDTRLSNLIYPVLLLYGSKVKGYGLKQADIDLAVFVKPGTDSSEHKHIQFWLKKIIPTKLKVSNFLEFWLEENDYSLKIRDWPDYDQALANSWYSHVLFNGVFFGQKSLIKKFYNEIIVNFFSKEKEINKQESELRRIWINGLERDVLQYRLLHKGYKQIRPIFPLIKGNYANFVDGDSPFWDSGYRQLATKLFIKKVYLP